MGGRGNWRSASRCKVRVRRGATLEMSKGDGYVREGEMMQKDGIVVIWGQTVRIGLGVVDVEWS